VAGGALLGRCGDGDVKDRDGAGVELVARETGVEAAEDGA